jgi:hypothetical protein
MAMSTTYFPETRSFLFFPSATASAFALSSSDLRGDCVVFACSVAISALVLAQKVWDDTPLINADFSILYPALTVKDINALERKFLDLLEFKLAVSPSLYAQYYFELRSICEENAQNFRPPPRATLKRVEQRSHLSEEYQKDKHGYKKRSMTIEDIAARYVRTVIS